MLRKIIESIEYKTLSVIKNLQFFFYWEFHSGTKLDNMWRVL